MPVTPQPSERNVAAKTSRFAAHLNVGISSVLKMNNPQQKETNEIIIENRCRQREVVASVPLRGSRRLVP